MARIRIIDEWLRSPVSPPSRFRAVMVVAESWSEQRVLMRAFASSADQTRPTIVLYGLELAIGPAGLDPHGQWGIHVEPPADGRAQELRGELELAARRLAGSKGNPPRLVDEVSRFESKATHLWAPGTPPDLPPTAMATGVRGYYEPAEAVARSVRPPLVPGNPPPSLAPADRATMMSPHIEPTIPDAPLFGGPAMGSVAPPIGSSVGSRTQPGFMPAGPPPAAPPPPVPRARPEANTQLTFASLVGRTMPLGLQLTQAERDVLNALGRAPALTADEVGRIAGTAEPVPWMDQFLVKLGQLGLDLVAPGVAGTGEPTYALRR